VWLFIGVGFSLAAMGGSGRQWAERGGSGVRYAQRFVAARCRLLPPVAALSSYVSNCHTGTNSLDCPVKYAPPLPPADLRDPGGPDRCADRPGRGGLGARGANGGAVRRGARGARRSGGVGTPDGGSNGHDPPLG